MMTMRYYLDTEFNESPGRLDLISIGLACEDGREFYAVADFNEADCNDWVRANVLPLLGDTPRQSREQIRDGVLAFIGDDVPAFIGYFAAYDWVAFCQLFGAMVNLPPHWPWFILDIRQMMCERGITKDMLPPKPKDAHSAIADARWHRAMHEHMRGRWMPL